MEWLVVLLAGGAASYAGLRLRALRLDRRERAEELAGVIRLAEEDVTVLGEQLSALGTELDGQRLDARTSEDYQQALDAYERAKWTAPRLQAPDEISALLDTVADGRYAMACVRARVAGEEPPERRTPCFFDPQHGPAVTDVTWRLARRGTRAYPACRQCAARAADGQKPELRTVRIGSRVVPYWEAGSAYLPYTKGYLADTPAAVRDAKAWAEAAETYRDGGHGL